MSGCVQGAPSPSCLSKCQLGRPQAERAVVKPKQSSASINNNNNDIGSQNKLEGGAGEVVAWVVWQQVQEAAEADRCKQFSIFDIS